MKAQAFSTLRSAFAAARLASGFKSVGRAVQLLISASFAGHAGTSLFLIFPFSEYNAAGSRLVKVSKSLLTEVGIDALRGGQ